VKASSSEYLLLAAVVGGNSENGYVT